MPCTQCGASYLVDIPRIENIARGNVLAPARNRQSLMSSSERIVYLVDLVHIDLNIFSGGYSGDDLVLVSRAKCGVVVSVKSM